MVMMEDVGGSEGVLEYTQVDGCPNVDHAEQVVRAEAVVDDAKEQHDDKQVFGARFVVAKLSPRVFLLRQQRLKARGGAALKGTQEK